MTEHNNVHAAGADLMEPTITVPILVGFDASRPIGKLTIQTKHLPPSPDFVFALGIQADISVPAAEPGTIPRATYKGPYKLFAVSIVPDANYAGYLQQVGVIPRHDKYQQAELPANAIEEANAIMMMPGMLVTTAGWRKVLGDVLATAERLQKIVDDQKAADTNNGWMRFIPGETKLVVDREYLVLQDIDPPYSGTEYFEPMVAKFQESRLNFAGDQIGPGFEDTCASIARQCTWYQEIHLPAVQKP